MTEQDLLELKQEITEAQEQATKLEGRKDLLLEQLKEKYGLTSLAEAKKHLKKLENEIEDMNNTITQDTEDLEKRLNDEQDTDTEDED